MCLLRGSNRCNRLLLLAVVNGGLVEFVQLNDSRRTAHQRRYRQPGLSSIFSLDNGPTAVDAIGL